MIFLIPDQSAAFLGLHDAAFFSNVFQQATEIFRSAAVQTATGEDFLPRTSSSTTTLKNL